MPAYASVFVRLSSLTLILVLLPVLQVENQLPERRVTCPPHSYSLAETDLDASVCETRTQAPLTKPGVSECFLGPISTTQCHRDSTKAATDHVQAHGHG